MFIAKGLVRLVSSFSKTYEISIKICECVVNELVLDWTLEWINIMSSKGYSRCAFWINLIIDEIFFVFIVVIINFINIGFIINHDCGLGNGWNYCGEEPDGFWTWAMISSIWALTICNCFCCSAMTEACSSMIARVLGSIRTGDLLISSSEEELAIQTRF